MRYLSLFSGIEAATVAWEPLGWQAVGFAEIEPYPCAVLKHHYPNLPNLGSVTEITESQIKKLGPIDLVVFGSPCQDLSVAGKRKGFDGERSGLFRNAVAIIKWARKHNGCRFALWENVPGALSSNEGKDFAEVLRLHTGASQPVPEKWRNSGVAFGKAGAKEWRILDAQYFGVPQRRRRIFALTDFGDWTGRPEILFERESLSGDSETGGEAWEGPAPAAGAGIAEGGGLSAYDMTAFGVYGPGKTASTLKQRDYKDATDLVVFNPKDDPVHSDQVAMTLQGQGNGMSAAVAIPIHDQATRHAGKRGDNQDGKGNGLGIGNDGDPMNTLTAGDKHAVCYSIKGASKRKDRPEGGLYVSEVETSLTLDTNNGLEPTSNQGGIAVCFQQNQRDEVRLTNGDGQVTGALAADAGMKQQNYVYCGTQNDALRDVADNLSPTLRSGSGGGAVNPMVASSSDAELAIRRLTPIECERLQGFPDNYSRIPWKNKTPEEAPDGPRYKALGNSMAVPVMRWIAVQLERALKQEG